jgi:hypothetical protein
MILDVGETSLGETGGQVHVGIIIGGFHFCIVNKLYKESRNYNDEEFKRIVEIFLDVDGSVTMYDNSSTDSNYLLEVEKLKKKFIINPSATFKSIGYVRKTGPLLNIKLEYIYIFDFHDIFINSYLDVVSFAMLDPYIYNSPFHTTMSSTPNKIITDNMLTGGHKTPDFWTQTLLSPVGYIKSYSDVSKINYHAGAQSCLFDYPSYCSVLIPINASCRNTENGLLFSVSLEHFKIKKNICCLAECFGIVE